LAAARAGWHQTEAAFWPRIRVSGTYAGSDNPVQAFMMTLVLRLRSVYGTLDIRELRTCLERDIAQEAGIGLPTSDNLPETPGVGPVRTQGGDA